MFQWRNQKKNHLWPDIFSLAQHRWLLFCLTLLAILLLTPSLVHAKALPVIVDDLAQVRSDIALIESFPENFTSNVPTENRVEMRYNNAQTTLAAPTLRGLIQLKGLDTEDPYKRYLEQASDLSTQLTEIDQTLVTFGAELSLQQLSALVQRAGLLESEFHRRVETRGNGVIIREYKSYQLMRKAIKNLQEAQQYWYTAKKFRRVWRPTVLQHWEDDELLKAKLKAAHEAMGELKDINDTREALDKAFELRNNHMQHRGPSHPIPSRIIQ